MLIEIQYILIFLFQGHKSETPGSGRFKVTSEKGAKIIDNGKVVSNIERKQRKRSYGPRFLMIVNNRRRHMNDERRRPVKNYDFYDQPSDFEWFKEQGQNHYPYHGAMPAYKHVGYDDYQKAPDSHAVAQAMTLLEKHISSSEALGSDNMFRNNERDRHGHQHDDEPMMNSFGNDVNGGNEHRYEYRNDNKFDSMPNDNNRGQEEQSEEYEQHNWKGHQRNANKNEKGEGENDKENGKGNEHMTESYQWKSVKGPELLHSEDLPSRGQASQTNEEHQEGWMPLKEHDSNHESHGNHNENDHALHGIHDNTNHESHGNNNENNHESYENHAEGNHESHQNHAEVNQKVNDFGNHESTASEMRSKNKEDDGFSNVDHGYTDGSRHMNDDNSGKASKQVQNNEPKEEYIDFPKSSDRPYITKDRSSRNNLVDKPFQSNSPLQSHEIPLEQEPAGSQRKPNNLDDDQAFHNDNGQPNADNIIKIKVGYPHYHVPNSHMEAAKIEPHQGPERGGGLWGDLPGVGEQYQGGITEQKNDNIKTPIDTKNRKIEVKGAFDITDIGKDVKNNRIGEKINSANSSSVTQIPVTIKTGVYDSREIFTIGGKKEFTSSNPVETGFKRRKESNENAFRPQRKSRKKGKRKKAKRKGVNKNRKKLTKRIKHTSNNIKFFSVQFPLPETFIKSRNKEKERTRKWRKNEVNLDYVTTNIKNEVSTRHGIGSDLDAVHGHPAISDEEALHSSPDELLDMANNYRHRAEEYDSKAKELENQAEIQDHQHDYHGSVSQHHPHHQGPERGGSEEEHGEGGQYHHHNGIGPWGGPMWHGPGPLGMSHFKHGGEEHGGHEEGHNEGEGGGHDHDAIHFNTGYPYYHVPRQHSIPLIEYEKPAPPVHGLNPYEVLTSEQFHQPMLPAGHGNLPYGHNQRTLPSKSDAKLVANKEIYVSKLDNISVKHSTIVDQPQNETMMTELLSDENIDNFLLK